MERKVVIIKHNDGSYLQSSFKGIAYTNKDIMFAEQFNEPVFAKRKKDLLKHSNEFKMVWVTLQIVEGEEIVDENKELL